MALQDPFCGRLGMTLPVVQAPIGSATTPALAAAVSEAGGLGLLALTWTRPDAAARAVAATAALTDRPFGINLVLQWDHDERLRACLDAGTRVVSTSWGDPAAVTDVVHDRGALHVHMVGSAAEARRAADAGVDAVVAQGWEAGGHVTGTVATLPLVPAVVDAVGPLPVLAGGGIADGRGLAAVLALGAVAGWVGTRFLLADEADVHPDYRARLIAAAETGTDHHLLYDGGWPDAPHRTLANSTLSEWEAAGRPAPGHRPGEGEPVAWRADGRPVPRYSSDLPTASMRGDTGAMALYSGQGVGLMSSTAPAGDIARGLADDASLVLRALAQPRTAWSTVSPDSSTA
jgi:NAD(P)H-dependent flavin oxidoreductase YrpB (nitropropane dioxygenase family)